MKEDGCTKVQLLNDKEVYGAGPREQHRGLGQGAGPDDHLQRGDRQERSELPLAGAEGQDPPARIAWCSPASPPTTRRRCSRTSPRRCRPRSSTDLTASPTRRSPAPRTASRRRSPTAPRSRSPRSRRTSTRRRARSSSSPTRRSTARPTPTRTRSTATRRWSSRSTPSSAPRPATRPTSSRRCSQPRTASRCSATYSIDANGDTSLTDYGVYSIKDGQLAVRQDDQGGDEVDVTMRG